MIQLACRRDDDAVARGVEGHVEHVASPTRRGEQVGGLPLVVITRLPGCVDA
jgi:hypothetical protein